MGTGLLVDRIELRRAVLHTHGVYTIVGALDGNRFTGEIVADPRAVGGSALLQMETGDAIVVGQRVPDFPAAGIYQVRARLATASAGATYGVSAVSDSRRGPEVRVASPVYRWYRLGRFRAGRATRFVLRLDEVIRAAGAGLLVDRVELRQTT
jgi:hypothetical protein